MSPPLQIIVFIGLQASGKSTFYQTFFSNTHIHISKDLLHNNKRPQRRQMQLIREALEAGQSIVIDNTHPTPDERKVLVELGAEYNAQCIGYYFRSVVADCKKRNAQRVGRTCVPDVAIYSTVKKLTRPNYSEGFEQLYFVCLSETSDSGFDVEPWKEEAEQIQKR